MSDKSSGALTLIRQCAPHLPAPVTEYKFHPDRKWRLDLAWPAQRVGLEVDGGQWAAAGGRHARDSDRAKVNALAAAGWRVLHVSPQMFDDPWPWIEALQKALSGLPAVRDLPQAGHLGLPQAPHLGLRRAEVNMIACVFGVEEWAEQRGWRPVLTLGEELQDCFVQVAEQASSEQAAAFALEDGAPFLTMCQPGETVPMLSLGGRPVWYRLAGKT